MASALGAQVPIVMVDMDCKVGDLSGRRQSLGLEQRASPKPNGTGS